MEDRVLLIHTRGFVPVALWPANEGIRVRRGEATCRTNGRRRTRMTVTPLERLPPVAGGEDLDVPARPDLGPRTPGKCSAVLRVGAARRARRRRRAPAAGRRGRTRFAQRRGGLQEMVLERAQADVALSVASAAASRAAQALTTLLGMQV